MNALARIRRARRGCVDDVLHARGRASQHAEQTRQHDLFPVNAEQPSDFAARR